MTVHALRRPRVPWKLLTFLIILDVTVRLLDKIAVLASAGHRLSAFTWTLLHQPCWWIGLGLGPLQLWVWMRILARTKLSVAYPLSSLGYPLTMVAAWLIFKEHLSWQVWLGAIFMTAGVALVGSADSRSLTPVEWPILQVDHERAHASSAH